MNSYRSFGVLISFCLLLLCSSACSVRSAANLESYGANEGMVSVSGLSSGAYLAVQLHVAFSQSIMGVGVVAGGPYYCAEGSSFKSGQCMLSSSAINVGHLEQETKDAASAGSIDPVANMNGDKVYLFGGKLDIINKQATVMKLEDYYKKFITSDNIHTEYSIWAQHAFLTEHYGNLCGYLGWPYINDCNYNQAYEILNHIYGNLQKPTGGEMIDNNLKVFNQGEFVSSSFFSTHDMDDEAYVYVPTSCQQSSSNCKVHVALHGCSQGKYAVGDRFIKHAGYNEVAQLNAIIILYPQAVANYFTMNLQGCWDWWGYSGSNYAYKQGQQMEAIKEMINRVTSD